MIHKIEEKDREAFLSLTRAFYASPAVLHPVPEEYHIAVFEEMMRSDVYAEGYLFWNTKALLPDMRFLQRHIRMRREGLSFGLRKSTWRLRFAERGSGGSFSRFSTGNTV